MQIHVIIFFVCFLGTVHAITIEQQTPEKNHVTTDIAQKNKKVLKQQKGAKTGDEIIIKKMIIITSALSLLLLGKHYLKDLLQTLLFYIKPYLSDDREWVEQEIKRLHSTLAEQQEKNQRNLSTTKEEHDREKKKLLKRIEFLENKSYTLENDIINNRDAITNAEMGIRNVNPTFVFWYKTTYTMRIKEAIYTLFSPERFIMIGVLVVIFGTLKAAKDYFTESWLGKFAIGCWQVGSQTKTIITYPFNLIYNRISDGPVASRKELNEKIDESDIRTDNKINQAEIRIKNSLIEKIDNNYKEHKDAEQAIMNLANGVKDSNNALEAKFDELSEKLDKREKEFRENIQSTLAGVSKNHQEVIRLEKTFNETEATLNHHIDQYRLLRDQYQNALNNNELVINSNKQLIEEVQTIKMQNVFLNHKFNDFFERYTPSNTSPTQKPHNKKNTNKSTIPGNTPSGFIMQRLELWSNKILEEDEKNNIQMISNAPQGESRTIILSPNTEQFAYALAGAIVALSIHQQQHNSDHISFINDDNSNTVD